MSGAMAINQALSRRRSFPEPCRRGIGQGRRRLQRAGGQENPSAVAHEGEKSVIQGLGQNDAVFGRRASRRQARQVVPPFQPGPARLAIDRHTVRHGGIGEHPERSAVDHGAPAAGLRQCGLEGRDGRFAHGRQGDCYVPRRSGGERRVRHVQAALAADPAAGTQPPGQARRPEGRVCEIRNTEAYRWRRPPGWQRSSKPSEQRITVSPLVCRQTAASVSLGS